MQQEQTCVICGSPVTDRAAKDVDGHDWDCPRCGNYRITGTAESILRRNRIPSSGAVSGWIHYQNGMGIVPIIDSDAVGRLRTLSKPTFRERAERYLITVVSNCPTLNSDIQPLIPKLVGASYSDDDGEAGVIVRYLTDEKLIEHRPGGQYRVTAHGFIAADDLRSRRAASTQAFIAMWFAEQLNAAYEQGIEPAVRRSGFEPMIIRKKEHANKIDDEIIAEIRRSAFLIADFTGHRGGVYFEAGFAMGLGLPVIWTCRRDEIEELHFDIRQYNCIDWSTPEEFADRLQKRIEAIHGRGPKQHRMNSKDFP